MIKNSPRILKDLSRAELDAVLELYVKTGLTIPDGLTTKTKIVEFIEAQFSTIGEPYILTEADIESDPALTEEGRSIGDVILIPCTTNEVSSSNPAQLSDEDAVEISVQYINSETGLIARIFSKAVHGDSFKEIAKAFSEKFNGVIL